MITTVLPYLQALLALGNLVIMAWALKTYLCKPHDTLAQQVAENTVKIKEVERSLLLGNDRFREQESTNEVMQSCMLALIDFELAYCIHTSYEDTDDLMRAKTELRKHLSRK